MWRMRDGIKEIIEEISENTNKENLIENYWCLFS